MGENTNGKFIEGFYVIRDLKNIHAWYREYGSIEDAVDAYKMLPSDKRKVIGFKCVPHPMPGSLDFIHCMDGKDYLVGDYKRVDGWDNSEVHHLIDELTNMLHPAGWL